jgi:hypothetical protein
LTAEDGELLLNPPTYDPKKNVNPTVVKGAAQVKAGLEALQRPLSPVLYHQARRWMFTHIMYALHALKAGFEARC